MATQWSTFPIEFRGGLISNLSALQHGTNAVGSATILQNFEPNKEGGYSKIKGYEKFSETTVPGSGPILGLKVISSGRIIVARKVDAAAITAVGELVAADENKTAYYYGTGTTWTCMRDKYDDTSFPLTTDTAAVTAGTNGGKARHVEYNLDGDDKVVFVDGTNFPGIYNTSGNTMSFLTAADSADVSGAEHVAIFKNTAFYSKGNNIFFTAPFTVDDFDVANGAGSINVGTDVTGLAVFRDQLIVFTTGSIKRLTGSTSADFQMSPITDRIGCINGDTIQEVGGDIIYLAPDGLRLLSATDRIGDFALDVASDKIQKDAVDFLNTASIFSSVILREKAQYRVFAYVSSERSDTSKGLLATKFISQGASGLSWATTKGIKAYVADSRYANDQETIAFANEDGYIYILNTGNTFDTGIIEAIYESPFMPISDPQIRKTFYKMTLYAEPTGNMNLDVNLKYDFASATNTKKVQPATFNITSTGNTVFEFGASNSNFGPQDPTDPTQVDTTDPSYDATKTYATYGGELDTVYGSNVIGSGKTVAIRIEDSSTNPTFTLDTALLEFRQNDRQ